MSFEKEAARLPHLSPWCRFLAVICHMPNGIRQAHKYSEALPLFEEVCEIKIEVPVDAATDEAHPMPS